MVTKTEILVHVLDIEVENRNGPIKVRVHPWCGINGDEVLFNFGCKEEWTFKLEDLEEVVRMCRELRKK